MCAPAVQPVSAERPTQRSHPPPEGPRAFKITQSTPACSCPRTGHPSMMGGADTGSAIVRHVPIQAGVSARGMEIVLLPRGRSVPGGGAAGCGSARRQPRAQAGPLRPTAQELNQPAAVPRGPRRSAGRGRESDGARSRDSPLPTAAPPLERGVPLALSRFPAEEGAHGPLLGQGRRGREAPLPSSEAPCARTGPSTRGNAAEGECRGPASTPIGRRRRGPSPRHIAHVGFPMTAQETGGVPLGRRPPRSTRRLPMEFQNPARAADQR